MRTWRLIAAALAAISLAACAQQFSAANQAMWQQVYDDYDARLRVMAARFPADNLGTEEERRALAQDQFDAHNRRRAELGAPLIIEVTARNNVDYLTTWPVYQRNEAERRRTEAERRQFETLLSEFDGRAVTATDLSRLAVALVDSEQPGLQGAARRDAIASATTTVRTQLESRRRTWAQQAAQRRELELARLAGTNLADMPREIARAAEQNLADARSPFDTRSSWRADAAPLRGEEVRLRDAVARRMEVDAQAARASAQAAADAARRDAVMQQCRMQAAMMGASVPTPYMGGGMGGILAAGLVGAIRQAEMEASALAACMRGAGL